MMAGNEAVENRPAWLKKVMWVLLVVLVPLLAAVVMIGIALQVLGVPVWRTTLQVAGLAPQTTASQSPLSSVQGRLVDASTKVATLTDQTQKLQGQLTDAQAQEKSLQDQVAMLQAQLTGHADTDTQAKTEANVLVGMDPSQAAAVLGKMSVDAAASVVAKMSAADSAQVLGAMQPDTAAQILTLAAQMQKATTSSATQPDGSANNQTGNQTGP